MKNLVFIIPIILFSNSLFSQVDPIENEIENKLENYEPEDDESELLQFADDLEDLKSQKIKINSASQQDLERLTQLNIFQIHNLMEYRRKTGYILSSYELLAVKGFDQDKIEDILPYLDFSLKPEKFQFPNPQTIKFSRNDFIFRDKFNLQKRKGFQLDSGGYLGMPHSIMIRYKFNFRGKIGAAIHLQQDAGEAYKTPSKKINIDFASFNVFLKDYRFINSLVIGDFNFEFGQGLNIWNGIGFGKSSNVGQIQRFPRGIIPYSGGEENRFFRGIASNIKIGKIDFINFYSKRKLDANLEEREDGQFQITSFQNSGLHRTENELMDQNSVELELINTSILYKANYFSLGFNQGFYYLDHPIKPKERPYQKFDLQNKNWQSTSLSAKYHMKNLSLFGEFSSLDYKTFAGIIGLQIKADEALVISVLHRNLAKDYQSFYSAPFAEKGSSGERGYYIGWDWTLGPILNWKSYVDFYQFSWSTFQSDFPSRGQDLMSQLDINLSKKFNLYLRFRYRKRQEDFNTDEIILNQIETRKINFRIQLNYLVSERVSLKNRLEISQNSSDIKRGFLAYQDFKYRFAKLPIQLVFRYSVFDIKDFENRIYSYENDLSQSFSVPANYGNGQRYYLLLKWKIRKNLGFEIKYAKTIFRDRNEISSGLNTVDGNELSELKMQFKLKL